MGLPTGRIWNTEDVESDGYQKYELVDPFEDFVSTKSASIDSLKRWRLVALLLNASRRFRYTMDLIKEQEKKQIITKIRTHAQAIRASILFQAAGEKSDRTLEAPPSSIPAGDNDLSPGQLTRDHDFSALQNFGGGTHEDEPNILASSSSSSSLELSIGNSGSSSVSRPNQELLPAHMLTGPSFSMEMEDWSRHPMLWHCDISMGNSSLRIVSGPNRELPPSHMLFLNRETMLRIFSAVVMVVMYPVLNQLIQLKFQDQPSPFKTHGFFAHTSVITYIIAMMALMILAFMKADREQRRQCSPATYYFYMIVKTVYYLTGILAPLSLVLVLLIPHRLMWIGYSIQFLVSLTIVACNLSDIAKHLYRKGMSKLGIVRVILAQRHTGPSTQGIASLV